MSDSDDNAFASADEGEEKDVIPKAEPKKAPVKQEKKTAKTASKVDAADKDSKDLGRSLSSTSQKDESKKGKGKQQQRNKKGKGGAASAQQRQTYAKQEPKVSEAPNRKEADTEGSTKESETKQEAKTSASQEQGSTGALGTHEKASGGDECSRVSEIDAKGDKGVDVAKESGVKQMEQKDIPKVSPEKVKSEEPRQSVVKSPEAQSIRASERDHHTPEQGKILNKLEETASSGSGWGWSSWGSSLISAASNSVQTFTNQVGDGLTTIMDTVESSLGVPDAETLAAADSAGEQEKAVTHQPEDNITKDASKPPQEKAKSEDVQEDKESNGQQKKEDNANQGGTGSGWFASWGVGDLAKKMQDTGKSLAAKGQTLMTEGFDAVEHLAAGGIDVLENIGKKTYNTLSEHDPALKRTRQFLSPRSNKPNLSSTLREAREEAEKNQQQEEATQEALKAHFGTLFDDNQGIAHLEALEILSTQSEKKVHSLLNSLATSDLAAIKPQLMDIKNAFQLDDESAEDAGEQDFSSLVQQHLSELELGTAPDKLNKVHQMVQAWITDFDSDGSGHAQSTKETHEKSIQALAELTAKGVEQFHKAGEMVLLDKDKDKDCRERAHSLARLTGVLCHEIGNLSNKFVECLNKLADEEKSEEVTGMITNIYLEASNSSTYIQDAFQLLLPVLQHAALEQAILARTS